MSAVCKQNKTPQSAGELFWTKVRDELRIYVIREKRGKETLKLYPLDEEEVGVDRVKIKEWSTDAGRLIDEIQEFGYADFICNKEHIREVFKQLRFERASVNSIDAEMQFFPLLEVLSLNENLIRVVENLPASLKELHAFSNSISEISPKLKPCRNIQYLGLGYNKLSDAALVGLEKTFPNLIGIDLSNNILCDIEATLSALTPCRGLAMLSLFGNPIAILPAYKKSTISTIRELRYFDNEEIVQEKDEVQSPQLLDASTKDLLAYRIDGSFDDMQASGRMNRMPTLNIEVNTIPLQEVRLRLSLSVLENIPEGNLTLLEKGSTVYPRIEDKPEYFQTTYFCEIELPGAFDEVARQRIDSRPRVVENINKVYKQKVQERLDTIERQESEYKRQLDLFEKTQAAAAAAAASSSAAAVTAAAGKKGAAAPAKPAAGKGGAAVASGPVKPEIPAEIPKVNDNLEGRAMVDEMTKEEDGTNRLDLMINLDEILAVSTRTRDFLRTGIIVRLVRSEPELIAAAGGAGEDDKLPVIDEATGLPKLVETIIGVCLIATEDLLQSKGKVEQKYVLFPPNVEKTVAEFFYPLQDENKQLAKQSVKLNEMLKAQEDADKPPEPTETVDPKKKLADKKKEVKKVDPKKPPPKGGAKGTASNEPEKKVVPVNTFPNHTRKHIFVDKDQIHLSLRKITLAASVQITS